VDALTGCPNRQAMYRALAKANAPACLVVLDMNDFMTFNDVHGHQAGDQVLAVVAGRLRAGVGLRGTVFRHGGQEFAILFPEQTPADAMHIVDHLLSAVMEPIPIRGISATERKDICVSATAGITALNPHDTHKTLMRADSALYDAKRRAVSYSVFAGAAPKT
jgi:diguanylate cyclase